MYRIWVQLFVILLFALFQAPFAYAKRVDESRIEAEVIAPYSLGNKTEIDGTWELLNGSGLLEGYVIETEAISPLPGFSGAPMNMMVMIDLEGVFIDVRLLSHNEPIFVSGLGELPFRTFLEQYRGQSLNTPMTIGNSYGKEAAGSLVYLDGVTKATASVRIAHESIMGAVREVAKQKLNGLVTAGPSAKPNFDYQEETSWQQLVDDGAVMRAQKTHGEVQALFKDTIWADDNPFSDRSDEALYADLWVLDVTPPSIAQAVMGERMLADLARLREIAPDDEYLLLIETADHGLVGDDFIRNTSPSLITLEQDGLPLILKDADLQMDLKPDLPSGYTMVVRVDRRLGFDPIRDWKIGLVALREHGMFQPEIGQVNLQWTHKSPERFFIIEMPPRQLTPFESTLVNRWGDLLFLAVVIAIAVSFMAFRRHAVKLPHFRRLRLVYLAICLGFIGWWGQGQLSIVTPLAVMSAISENRSLEFLVYDPFSLFIWVVTIISFFLWGRALFCGWLCPFGAFQEWVSEIAKWLHIRQIRVKANIDVRLKYLKYVLIFGLVLIVLFWPEHVDKAAEIEPFKTAISVFFVRNWYYVLYAVICLASSALVYKGYCRYVCPLGAFMSIGGWLRLSPWIERRQECGSPCQLCKAKCAYQAIKPTGDIDYRECFGCLDCVDIFEDAKTCVPLILKAKGKELSK